VTLWPSDNYTRTRKAEGYLSARGWISSRCSYIEASILDLFGLLDHEC